MQTLFLHVEKTVFAVCKNYFYRLQKPFLQRLHDFRDYYLAKGNNLTLSSDNMPLFK